MSALPLCPPVIRDGGAGEAGGGAGGGAGCLLGGGNDSGLGRSLPFVSQGMVSLGGADGASLEGPGGCSSLGSCMRVVGRLYCVLHLGYNSSSKSASGAVNILPESRIKRYPLIPSATPKCIISSEFGANLSFLTVGGRYTYALQPNTLSIEMSGCS